MKVRFTSLGVDYDLTLPVTIKEIPTAPPNPATFSIAASPTTITAGQSATITCQFQNVGGAWLLYGGAAYGLAGPTSTTVVTPVVTTEYTLRVKLPDGTFDESKKATVTVNNPPPPVTGAPWLGVNTIVSKPSAFDAASKGCRAFLMIDSENEARQIKQQYPDAVVVARRWIPGTSHPNGDQLADMLGAANDGVIYELLNEADNWSYGTVAQISNRIDIELRATSILRARGVKVCMGGYSMGTPDFTNADIINQVKRYAAVYNSDPGVYFSMHLYSPSLAHTPDIWYERRYEWLFTKCGFNPALRKVIATETGLDEGGVGGFPAHHATTLQFETWCATTQTAHQQPIIVNGISYPSPYLAGMLFQYSQNTNPSWSGYEVSAWIGSLQARGWK